MGYRLIRTRRALATLALLAASFSAAGGAGAAQTGPEGDIPAAPGADVLVTTDPDPVIARNSPSLAVNPLQITNVVVVDRVDRPDYGAGVHLSNDGGGTWQDKGLAVPAGSAGKPYAPTAAFDARGTLSVLFTTLAGPGNAPEAVWVTRSGDGGLTFDPALRVTGAHAFQATFAVDVRSGRLYAAWLQSDDAASECNLCFARTGLPIVVSQSGDGGRTWSPPVRVSDPERARVGAPSLAVSPEGGPVVLYVDYGDDRLDWENLPGTYDGRFSLVLARSPARPTGGRRSSPVGWSTATSSRPAASWCTSRWCPVWPSTATVTRSWSGPTVATATPTSCCAARPARVTSSTRRSGLTGARWATAWPRTRPR